MRMTRVEEVLIMLALACVIAAYLAYGTSGAPNARGQTVLAFAAMALTASVGLFIAERLVMGRPEGLQPGPILALVVAGAIAVTATMRANALADRSKRAR